MKLTGDLLNRRSGRIVQGRPLRARALGQHFRVVHTSGIVWGLATVAALAASIPTVRFSGRTYPKLARIVREFYAAAGRCLAVTVAVSRDLDCARAGYLSGGGISRIGRGEVGVPMDELPVAVNAR